MKLKAKSCKLKAVIYDLAIIGGGPAGVSAGVYASRKRLKTVYITADFGGQSTVSPEIQNWIGTVAISGLDLAKNLKEHLKAYAGKVVDIKEGELAEKVEKTKKGFEIKTNKNVYEAKTILVATGSSRRKIPAVGADKFEHKGITYCASCDGPLFADQDVMVVGAGNAAFETAAQLLAYCKSVTMLVRSERVKADEVTIKKVSANPKFKMLTNTQIAEIKGDQFVDSVILENTKTGEKKEVPIGGIFAEVGSVPNSGFVRDLVELNEFGQIVTNPRNQETSAKGIWAAGDVTNGLYHQNNIASGDAVKALEDIYLYLHAK